MFVFFLIIHLILAVIFYLFHDVSGRYYESVFFLIAGFLFFFYFSPFYIIGSSEKSSEKQSKFLAFLDKEKLKNIIPKSRKLLYIWAVILFYLSVYGIFYSFSLEFDYFIIGIAIFFFLLFFLAKQYFPREIISLAFRTNTLFFSVIFFARLCLFFIQPGVISWIFILENLIFFLSQISILLWDNFISPKAKKSVFLLFLGYVFTSLLFYTNTFIFSDINISGILLGTLMSVIYFEYISRIPNFKMFDIISKYFWLFLSYLTLLYITILLFFFRPYFSVEVIGLFFLGAAFQYYVHKKFENYISYLFSIIVIIVIYSKIFYLYEVENFFFYFLFTLILPGLFIAYTFFIKNIHPYDYYILYVSMILFSIGGIVAYFYHIPFSIDSILPASLFLLLESALFFVSFVRLKK